MEVRHGHTITVLGSDRMQGANFTVERTAATHAPVRRAERAAVNMDWGFDGDNEPAYTASEIETTIEVYDEEEAVSSERNGARSDSEEGGARRGRRRRRRGRGGRDRGDDRERFAYEANDDANAETAANDDAQMDSDEAGADISGFEDQPSVDDGANAGQAENNGSEERPNKRRRRGRRGGRRGRDRGRESEQTQSADDSEAFASESEQSDQDDDRTDDVAADDNGEKSPEYNGSAENKEKGSKVPSRRPRRVWDVPSAANGDEEQTATPAETSAEAAPTPEPVREPEVVVTPEPAPSRRRHETGSSEPRIERVVVGPNAQSDVAESEPASAPAQRKGWWQRKFGGE
jgi:ribonuclease E